MSEPRRSPYIYCTWLSKVIAGEDQCTWKSWFKAHNTWDKVVSDFDLTKWTIDHNNMLGRRAGDLRKEGYNVYIEAQNSFNFEGKSGITVAGKPDIVAIKDGKVLVVDCKTGKERHSDNVQVMIYMLILPYTHAACKGLEIDGEVQYNSGSTLISRMEISTFQDTFAKHVKQVGGIEPLQKVPSQFECRYCDIGRADCKERMEEQAKTTTTEMF